jgi:asparagine synthase (glutamine-hydrolysing)
LLSLAPELMGDFNKEIERKFGKWLLDCDGDFIIVIIAKNTGDLVLFNDAIGRLPLYYQIRENAIVMSREPKFIILSLDNRQIDEIGLAEYLIFGHNLSKRTFSKNIKRFPPASLARFSISQKKCEVKQVYEWNCHPDYPEEKPFLECSRDFAAEFLTGIENRLNANHDLKPVLALSGGLDSRAVMFGILKIGGKFSAYTTLTGSKYNKIDAEVSSQLTELTGIDWKQFRLGPAKIEDYLQLAFDQESGSSVFLAFASAGYKHIHKNFGDNIRFFTGDGGNQVMYSLKPPLRFKSVPELTEYITNVSSIFDLEEICRILGLNKSSLEEKIITEIEEFPENDLRDKYAHFKVFSRGVRFVLEGEDRSRFHFWTSAPFWNVRLLKQSLMLPDRYKANFRMYIKLFEYIDKRALEIKYSNIRLPLTSPLTGFYMHLKSIAKSQKLLFQLGRRIILREQFSGYSSEPLNKYLRMIANESNEVGRHIDLKALAKAEANGFTKMQYYLLATVVLRIALIENNFEHY